MRSFTNRALGVGGDSNTTSVTVRLPDEVVEYIDSHFTGRIKNRSEFLQHWAQVGVRVSDDEDLDEALDWALDQSVQEITAAALSPEALGVDAVEVVEEMARGFKEGERAFEAWKDELATPLWGEPVDIVAEIVPPEKSTPDELTSLRESQLEALRSRVK